MSDTEVAEAKTTLKATVRENKIAGMRAMLDLLEAQPLIPMPGWHQVNVFVYEDGPSISDMARAMKPVNKLSEGDYFILERKFNDNIQLHMNYSRKEVCEMVVVRTEEVPARLVEAYTREVVEWKCPESILDIELNTDDDNDDKDEDDDHGTIELTTEEEVVDADALS